VLFGILVGVLLSHIAFILAVAMGENTPLLQVIQATAAIAVALSAIVGLNVYLTTIKRHNSEDARKESQEYLHESRNCMERTFEIFTDNGRNTDPPRNSRVLWQMTASMFLRYYRIKEKISQADHREIINEHEEYWRMQFYNLLDRNRSKFDLLYLQPSCEKCGTDTEHMNAIGIIFDFARCTAASADSLRDADGVAMHARGAVPADQHGIRQFIQSNDAYHAMVEQRTLEFNSPAASSHG
jgi:hypothetical protein